MDSILKINVIFFKINSKNNENVSFEKWKNNIINSKISYLVHKIPQLKNNENGRSRMGCSNG